MKANSKFITLTVTLLLGSTALLTGCMAALAAAGPKEKTFDSSDVIDMDALLQGSVSSSESELQMMKFGEYSKIETDADGRRTLILFPDGQVDLLMEKRENGESMLSYEDILDLIDDSIQLYNQYDTIILSSANRLGLAPMPLSGVADWVIYPSYADESEMSYDDYCTVMLTSRWHIYTIILYRLYLLDAGLFCYQEKVTHGFSYYDSEIRVTPYNDPIEPNPVDATYPVNKGFALVIGADQRWGETYPELLLNCLHESKLIPYSYFMGRVVQLPEDVMLIDFSQESITVSKGQTVTSLYPASGESDWQLDERDFETDSITISIGTYYLDQIVPGQTFIGAQAKQLLEALDAQRIVRDADDDWTDHENVGLDLFYIVDFGNGTKIVIPVKWEEGTAVITNERKKIREPLFTKCVPAEFTKLVKELYKESYPETLHQMLETVDADYIYWRSLNQLIDVVKNDERLSDLSNIDGILELPKYAEFEELVLSDRKYAYLALRDWFESAYLLSHHIGTLPLLRNNENFRELYENSNIYTAIEMVLTDPEKYLPC